MNLLTQHLGGLFRFSGRENRQPFWLWVLIVYAAQMVIGMAAMIPVMMAWTDRMAPLMQGGPDPFQGHPERMFEMMAPMMNTMVGYALVASVIWLILVAAAVVRRLHDGDRSGWWFAPVLAFHVAGPLVNLAMMPRFFEAMTKIRPEATPEQVQAQIVPVIHSFAWVSLFGMIGFLATVVLIVFLVLPGTDGPNRYGENPLAVAR